MASQTANSTVEAETEKTKFVVGLGNPGRQYARTRHNVGFDVVAALRRRWSIAEGKQAFGGLFYDARVTRGDRTQRVMLLEPQTFMNCSGRAVRAIADFYKAAPGDMLIVLDDFALPLGRLRCRPDGSAGGHNGLADILTAMGTQSVPRLRLGIGSPPGRMEWKDFVLTTFRGDELDAVGDAVELAADAVEDWVFRGLVYVMEKYNRKTES